MARIDNDYTAWINQAQEQAALEEAADWADLKAAKRVAHKLTPEMLADLNDNDLVVVPRRMVKNVA